ncbi:outer membrane protein assembly factor BamB family protein [Gimesia panareensis]|uniref:outer membrane protein assembly factor BamB family protein n=1 Tax=Gimesia panareensis TaxID=2527978 RepID=UPI00118CBAD8|nr:PQQ-binding-like beta-propeller repeat protein [Gimesia panareensis]QDU47725.1 Serine/threonine-protein kinase AfsK [Gimesia panareensis]
MSSRVLRLAGLSWICLLSCLLCTASLQAEDWPAWRKDAQRTAATSEQLPETLHLQWSRQLGAIQPAWPEDPRIQFDAHYEPVISGDTIFVGSSRNDSVSAFDLNSGQQKWRYYANGPVRFAPLVSGPNVYFAADDGCFYCLNAADGSLRWKFRAAPNGRKALANGRLSSVWPIRGGAVLSEGKIYFTCGVWPFEGTFLYTLDAETGAALEPPQPEMKALKGLTPQGYLVKNGNRLLIPCGRSVAACLDLETGKFISHRYGNRATNYHVSSIGPYIFHGGSTFQMDAKKEYDVSARNPVLTDDKVYFAEGGKLVAYDLEKLKIVKSIDRRGKEVSKTVLNQIWSLPAPQPQGISQKEYAAWAKAHPPQLDLKAGNQLFGHQGKMIFALDLAEEGKSATVSWTKTLTETPASMIAANGALVVVTQEGSLLCFSDKQTEPDTFSEERTQLASGADEGTGKTRDLLALTQPGKGYCLVLGAGDGRLLKELVQQSDLNIIAVEPDQQKVADLRQHFDKAGVYGSRIVILQGEPLGSDLPAYLAELIVSADLKTLGEPLTAEAWKTIYHSLRPYGGQACLALSDKDFDRLSTTVNEKLLPRAKLERKQSWTLLTRVGALPGSADWTHEYGDASNTLMSHDELVKAPLGVLWFGGPAGHGDLFYNRHDWGPSTAVIQGRMFLQGPGKLTAVDVYTGQILWQIPLKETPENSPGRRGQDYENKLAGFHFLATDDSIYLVNSDNICLRLDPATGKTLAEFKLPNPEDQWGRIRVHEDLLLTSAFRVSPKMGKKFGKLPLELIAMNRHTGKIIWKHPAKLSFPVVSLSDDRIYVFDGALENFYSDYKRRGEVPKALAERYIKAIDVQTGKVIWEQSTDVIGTWISYSKGKDVLLVTNREGISAFRGKDGSELWKKYAKGQGFRGHPENLWDKIIIWNDRILDQRGPGKSYDLETGEPILRTNPITGKPIPWEFTKSGHHCNYAIASPHLMTFRADSAGFCDIDSTNTSRLEGFRTGCRNSLVPANGVLNSPNMAHGCSCGYSLFTSLALTHVPESEVWSYSALAVDAKLDEVQRVGINLGAPGDRQADNGTLWLDYPNVGGSSPVISVHVAGNNLKYFRKHSAFVESGDLKWVAASGAEGLTSLTVKLAPDAKSERRYTVRLYFLEPEEGTRPGQRIFDVSLQGKPVLQELDIVKAAQGDNRGTMHEFQGVAATDQLTVELNAIKGSTLLSGVEIIAEEAP